MNINKPCKHKSPTVISDIPGHGSIYWCSNCGAYTTYDDYDNWRLTSREKRILINSKQPNAIRMSPGSIGASM